MCNTKIFFIISFNFSERILSGIVDVFDETIDPFFSFLKIFS